MLTRQLMNQSLPQGLSEWFLKSFLVRIAGHFPFTAFQMVAYATHD